MTHLGHEPLPIVGNRMKSHAASGDYGADRASYINRIKTYPILTKYEEQALIDRCYRHGERKACDALIESHLRLVPKIAQRYAGYGIAFTELIGEGNLGLLQSAERFQPDKGFRFSTYARWWIKAAMLNFILQAWSLIKVGSSAGTKRLFFNLRRAQQDVQTDGQRYLHDADIEKLAKRFRVSYEDVVAMDQRMSAIDVSLNQSVPGSDDLTFGDVVADTTPTPEELVLDADERRWHAVVLREAISRLNRREKEIVVRRHLTNRPATLATLATRFGLTAERVRQIETKAIEKMHHYLAPKPGPRQEARRRTLSEVD